MDKIVSLLLTTFNSAQFLARTLASIEKQDYPLIQVCVADSCSVDGTLTLLEDYSQNSKYDVVYASQKDSGIYEGLNNALALAKGSYILVMNDELTVDDAISKLVSAIEESDRDVIGAHSDLIYSNPETRRVIRYWRMGQGRIRSGWMPAHPTLMLKKTIYEQYGGYDTSYTCSADYEYMIRILRDGNKLAYVPEVLVSMYYGGTSNNSIGAYLHSITEAIRALHKNGIYPAIWITIRRLLRVVFQFGRSYIPKNNNENK